MFDFITNSDIDRNIGSFILFLVVISLLSMFHSLIFGIIKKIEPKWLLYAVYNAIGAILYLINPGFTAGWVIFLFASIFVFVILATVISFIWKIAKGTKDILTNKTKSFHKRIIELLFVALAILLFVYTGPFFFLIVFVGIFISSILTGNTFFKLQAILPTSKIRSMAMGLVEVEGTVKETEKEVAPIGFKKCIGYRYTIESIKRDKDGDKSYSTVHNETKLNPFIIEDDTGSVEVIPEKLDFVKFPVDEQYSTGTYRYTQYVLYNGSEVLLIGKAGLMGNKPVLMHEDIKDVFGISPVSVVNRWNRFKPLRSTILLYLMTFGFMVGLILLLSINEVEGRIIVSLPQNIFSWSF
jgi:hypothetical protein